MSSANDAAPAYQGSTYNELRTQLLSDPYTGPLPTHDVTIGSMIERGQNLLLRDSRWLISREEDLTPPQQKLLNPIGITFFGKWKITEDLGYTGAFSKGTEHLIIVRFSNQMTAKDRGTRRGFGFAGKIFPTLDPNERVKTVNFTLIDNLGGTFAKHATDVALTNEPPLGLNLGMIPFFFVVTNVVAVFNIVNRPSLYRAIYQIAEAGLKPGETAKQPKWMQITTDPSIPKNDSKDFRDELRLKNYPGGILRFIISVAPPGKKRVWQELGHIEVNEDVLSFTGDKRMRFHHNPGRGIPE